MMGGVGGVSRTLSALGVVSADYQSDYSLLCRVPVLLIAFRVESAMTSDAVAELS